MQASETSTGVAHPVKALADIVRPLPGTILIVDAITAVGVMNIPTDEWGLDVTVSGSQKGMMLPPGLAVLAVSERALEANARAALPRSYWDWSDQIDANARGFFPYTPATNLLFGLEEALAMLGEEGLDQVFARHAAFARATRAAVRAWGLEPFAVERAEASGALTSVLVPEGHDADVVRAHILERFDMSLGTGLGDLKGKLFRIGHLGDLSVLTLMGTLAGVEMGLAAAGVPHRKGGVAAAMDVYTNDSGGNA